MSDIDYDALAAKHGGTAVGGGQGSAVSRVPYSGAPDLPLQAPGPFGLLDPLNFLPAERTGEAALALGRLGGEGVMAAGRAMGSAIPRVGSALGRAAGAGALEAGMEFLPAPLRIVARMAMAAARKTPQAAEAAGSAASRTLAEPTAKQAAEHAMGRIVGRAEAQAYREGGHEAVAAVRAKKAAEKASEAGKSLAEHRWGKPEVVGKIEPTPTGPKATAAQRSAASRTAPYSDVAARNEAGVIPKELRKPRDMLTHQYYSKSRGTKIDIESMNQRHIEQAIRQLVKENPKPGSTQYGVLQDLIKESKFRYHTTGLEIGHASARGGH